MTRQNMFNNEVELTKFLGSLDVIQHAFRALLDTTLPYVLHTTPSGIKVLAFNCRPDYTTRFLNGEFDLVSSENHRAVDVISTEVNSSFCINKAAVELFEYLSDDLKDLEKKHINTPLVVTGSGLGGYLAILSALRLLQAVDVEESNGSRKTKRPICITFGSPFLGDDALQGAISERPQWKSSFLNVVANKDPVATFFTSNTPYKPLGTTLFCTDSGGHSAFEDHEEVLAVLDVIASSNAGSNQIYDYGNVLSSIRKKVLYRRVTESGDLINSSNSLKAGITMQLKEVGVLEDISNDLIRKMEERRTKMIKRKRSAYDPTKKLNDMKVGLIYIELYMKVTKTKGGYYDSYKQDAKNLADAMLKSEIIKQIRTLNYNWKMNVERMKLMPQEDPDWLKPWLYSGTTYRRIVEPLDIAEYYRKGNTNYIQNRPNHYKLLENWLVEHEKDGSSRRGRKETTSLTKDSCFWAYVEEAVISLKNLEEGASSRSDIAQGLQVFEANVGRALTAVRSRWIGPW